MSFLIKAICYQKSRGQTKISCSLLLLGPQPICINVVQCNSSILLQHVDQPLVYTTEFDVELAPKKVRWAEHLFTDDPDY